MVAGWPEGVNVGIATGDGLVVVDVDERHGGGDALHGLERRHGPLPETACVKTGGGGEHYFYATAAVIRNSAGVLAPGIDTRGVGGYIVAPPSRHPSGRRYEWDLNPDDVDLAPLPAWIERQLAAPAARVARPVSEWRELAAHGASEGQRNHACARLSGHLLARDIDPYVVLELVLAWNARNRRRCPTVRFGASSTRSPSANCGGGSHDRHRSACRRAGERQGAAARG